MVLRGFTFCGILMGLAAAAPHADKRQATLDTPIRLLTWNLRYDSQPNSISIVDTIAALPRTLPADSEVNYYVNSAEVPWSTRRISVANDVVFNRVDVLAVQEALKRQVADLEELLGTTWGRIGVGRDDGIEAGEYSAIFYRKSAVTLKDWDTFWLSNTPFIPSKYPGAGSYRATTLAHFRAGTSGKPFTLMCTHWDNVSDDQRRLAASLIRYRGAYEAATTTSPVFILGDFNSPSTGTDSGGFQIITGETQPVEIGEEFREKYKILNGTFVFQDVSGVTPPERRSGHHATFTGFNAVGNSTAFSRIDFIMGGSNGGWASESYRVGETLYDNSDFSSDHRPVYSDILI